MPSIGEVYHTIMKRGYEINPGEAGPQMHYRTTVLQPDRRWTADRGRSLYKDPTTP